MILQLMANDDVLTKKLKATNLFDSIQTIFEKEELTGDCIVISDEILPYGELQELEFKSEQTVFYMLHSQYDSGLEKAIKTICDSRDIILIPPRLTIEQIINEITYTFNKNITEQSNVITFFSSIGNIGTTSTCLSVAKSLSENTTSKVGVLLLNAWDHGTHQMNYKGEYLDLTKGRIENQALSSKEEFLSLFHMEKEDSLYVLGGNRYTKLERLYTKESINYLISLAKKYFDVVLIDAGCHFDNANMVQALYESDFRLLVVNQQPKATQKFNLIFDEILYPLGYKKTDFLTIINQFIDKPQLPKPKEISDELDILNLATIYSVAEPLYSEIEKKTLYDFQDEVYNASIYNVSKAIINHANLQVVENEINPKKKRWFNR